MATVEELRTQFTSDGVRHVKIGGFDVDGVLRGKYVSLEKFFSVVEGGMGFCDVIFGWDSADNLYDNSQITGWHTGYPDVAARIDLSTYRRIPWEPDTAAFLLDFATPASPRSALTAVLDRLRSAGFSAQCAVELEFFVYREAPSDLADRGFMDAQPLSPGMFGYSWLRSSQASDLVHALLDQLDAFDIPLEGFHTETGPGVFEAAIRYTDALQAADRAALFKTAVKEIAHRHGLMATFMAKPANGLPGCSGHIHQSLWKEGRNAFFDAQDPEKMSTVCKHFIAGQLALMPELTALVAPNTNSYKRILDQNWAPGTATWGIENRTCALRMIPGSEKATRIEHRLGGADLNSHIAMASMLAAGLYGIQKELPPPDPVRGNAYAIHDAPALPTSLSDAVASLRESKHAPEILGREFIDHYLRTRAWEVRESNRAVTDWELKRYFELA